MKPILLPLVILGAWLVPTPDLFAQTIPTQNMLLWLRADAGVVTDGTGVATWQDQSSQHNNAQRKVGTMQHATANFGTGNHDVIRFLKDGFFTLNTEPLEVPKLSVYAVVQQAATDFDDRIVYFSTYSNNVNWGYGVNLDLQIAGGTPISRMFTSAGTPTTLSDYTMPGPQPGMHYITTQIDSTDEKMKRTYADGQLLDLATVPGLSYFTDAETASIGTLGQLEIPFFYYAGDIAEIIVYSSVDSAQRTAVESYLNDKYFGFVTPTSDADFDGNGTVDGNDLLIWQRGLGSGSQTDNSHGDANLSGTVDSADLAVWASKFGGPPIAVIPEPGSAVLALGAATGLASARRRKLA